MCSVIHPVESAKEAKVDRDTYCNIVPCGPPGVYNEYFCCTYPGNVSCCNETFLNGVGYPTTIPANSNSTLTSHNKTSSDSSTAIGAGVRVPLGVLLLSSLCFLFYREWKRRLSAATLVQNNHQATELQQEDKTQEQSAPHELEYARKATPELESR